MTVTQADINALTAAHPAAERERIRPQRLHSGACPSRRGSGRLRLDR